MAPCGGERWRVGRGGGEPPGKGREDEEEEGMRSGSKSRGALICTVAVFAFLGRKQAVLKRVDHIVLKTHNYTINYIYATPHYMRGEWAFDMGPPTSRPN